MSDVHVQVDFDEVTPLHEQVAAEIRRAIADGEALPGERLPPARDLAAVLGVNANTVLRSLRQLREEGLLEFRRGRGITVVGDAPEKSVLIAKARELVRLARSQGYRRDELIEIIQGVRWHRFPPAQLSQLAKQLNRQHSKTSFPRPGNTTADDSCG
jgi:GntR family transcriptional regulator